MRLADDKVVYSVGKGSVLFRPCISNQPARLLEFHDVLHVPSLRSNLLSVLYLTRQKQYTVTIERDSVKLAIEGVSANFALKHTVRPAGLCECKG